MYIGNGGGDQEAFISASSSRSLLIISFRFTGINYFIFLALSKFETRKKKPCTKLFPKIKFWHHTNTTGELKYGFPPDRSAAAAAAVRLLITHIGDQLAMVKRIATAAAQCGCKQQICRLDQFICNRDFMFSVRLSF